MPRTALLGGIVLGMMALVGSVCAEDRPVVFEVRVPADATVEINGKKTTSTGAVRRYEAPPLAPGKTYTYTLKIVAQGKEIVEKIEVGSDKVAVFDLREKFSAKPPTGNKYDREGFVTFVKDNRLWVFRTDSKDLAEFKKLGEVEKHVTRIAAGPDGMTIKAPDAATLDAYLKATQK